AGPEVGLGALGDAARVARVRLHRRRLEDVAGQVEGGVGIERVQVCGGRIGQQDHVRLVDALPAGDRGAVEHLSVLEQPRFDDAGGEGDVLLHAAHVHETQVDELDLVVLDQFLDVLKRHGGAASGWRRSAPIGASAVPTGIHLQAIDSQGPAGNRCAAAHEKGEV